MLTEAHSSGKQTHNFFSKQIHLNQSERQRAAALPVSQSIRAWKTSKSVMVGSARLADTLNLAMNSSIDSFLLYT